MEPRNDFDRLLNLWNEVNFNNNNDNENNTKFSRERHKKENERTARDESLPPKTEPKINGGRTSVTSSQAFVSTNL